MKQSGLMKRENAAYLKGIRDGHRFMRQLMADFACIVLHDSFKFSRNQINRFYDEMTALHDEYAVIFNSDSKDQEYSRAVLDKKLKQIAGDRFVPWEDRYA